MLSSLAPTRDPTYMEKYYYVYIMTNRMYGTLYTGVTNDLVRRVYEHKNSFVDGFTKKHDCKILVYYEIFGDVDEAIKREKQLKKWKRTWKIQLIEKENISWEDLYEKIL